MKKRLSILFFIWWMASNAQERLGISTSNYSPTNSIFLNPATTVDSKAFAQLNLVSANVYAMTNQAYLPNFSVRSAIKDSFPTPRLSSIKIRKFAYVSATVDGPAFTLSHRNFGLGFFVRGRAIVDIRNIPYELTNILLQQQPNPTLPREIDIRIRNAKVSGMAWAEYGANFGMMIRKRGYQIISVGANARYLTGINISYANLEKLRLQADFTSLDVALKAKARFNEPAWNAGRGVGIDAGIVYKRMLNTVDSYYPNSKKSNCISYLYRYKVGLSLLDAGAIRFTKGPYKAGVDAAAKIEDYTKVKSVSDLLNSKFSAYYNNNPIWASLPTAISAQLDWYFDNNFYLATTIIQNITTSRVIGVQRSQLWSINPRWAFRHFEVSAPLTFQRHLYPQLGFALRLRSFVLGFDNVFPLLLKKDTYGLNVYVGLGITMFKNPACREPRKRKIKLKKIFGENLLGEGRLSKTKPSDIKKEDPVECADELNLMIDKKEKTKPKSFWSKLLFWKK